MPLRLMGKKKGMTRVYDDKGVSIVCTVIEAEPNIVVQLKTKETDGYSAVQLGGMKVLPSKLRNVTKPMRGHFAKAKVEPRRTLGESRVDSKETYEVGQEVGLDYFADAPYVDVTGVSKGKGFQGVIKRHGFSGGRASHGASCHRAAGSTGMRSSPGRVFLNKKMAGRMGGDTKTVECLKVVRIDQEKNVILVKGPIPGADGGLVYVRKSLKRPGKGA